MQDTLRALLIQNIDRGLLLATAAAIIVLISGRWCIHVLRAYNIRKRVRQVGHDPQAGIGQLTMGGVMIIIPVLILTVLFNLIDRWSMLLPLGVMLCYAVLGGIDDYYSLEIVPSTHYGLTERTKAILQAVIAIAAGVFLYWPAPIGLQHSGLTWVPFIGQVDVGWWFIPLAAAIIWVTVNAVNITDGVDGLSGWTLLIAFFTYGVIAFINGQFTNLMALSMTLVGACAGYLWYNAHLGSMALGGALAVIALQSQQWVLLPIVGIIFVVEGLSSFIQVVYFKYTRWRTGEGVRIFKMAPLHHHLRIKRWSNPQITQRFVVINMASALLAVSLALWT
jgi:phospho-N-acetylmuramoyl-pentapeptide-transferase